MGSPKKKASFTPTTSNNTHPFERSSNSPEKTYNKN